MQLPVELGFGDRAREEGVEVVDRARAVQPAHVVVTENDEHKHMWSLPGFRSAADAAKAPCELDPLERLPCDGLVLQRPARCPAAGRSEAVNRRKIDLPAKARSVPSRPLMNVTITG